MDWRKEWLRTSYVGIETLLLLRVDTAVLLYVEQSIISSNRTVERASGVFCTGFFVFLMYFYILRLGDTTYSAVSDTRYKGYTYIPLFPFFFAYSYIVPFL